MRKLETASSRPAERSLRRRLRWTVIALTAAVLGWWGLQSLSIRMKSVMTEMDLDLFARTVQQELGQRPTLTRQEAIEAIAHLISASIASGHSSLEEGVPVDCWGAPYDVRWTLNARDRATITCRSAGPDRTLGTSDDVVVRRRPPPEPK